jgi:hypothetical protein
MKRLLLLAPVLIIVGCFLFGGKDYFPLTVDNEWKYEGHSYTTADSSTIKKETKITGEDQINSKDVFIAVRKTTEYEFYPIFDTTEETDTSYIKEDQDTIWIYDTKTDSTPMLLTILPFELDKTWNVIHGADTTVYTVKAQEDVTVPSDTYKKCWKLEMKHGTNASYFWFADGTGIVKQSWSGYLLELTEATIK